LYKLIDALGIRTASCNKSSSDIIGSRREDFQGTVTGYEVLDHSSFQTHEKHENEFILVHRRLLRHLPKRSAYQIPSGIVVFVVLTVKVYCVILIPKSRKRPHEDH
jgi:hypothetical protein